MVNELPLSSAFSEESDELLAPFRRQVEASGLTESEPAHLFEEARDEALPAEAGTPTVSTLEDPPRVVFDCMVFLRGLARVTQQA